MFISCSIGMTKDTHFQPSFSGHERRVFTVHSPKGEMNSEQTPDAAPLMAFNEHKMNRVNTNEQKATNEPKTAEHIAPILDRIMGQIRGEGGRHRVLPALWASYPYPATFAKNHLESQGHNQWKPTCLIS